MHCVDHIVQNKEAQYHALYKHSWLEVLITEILTMGWFPEHEHQKQPHQHVSECLN